MLPLSHVHNSPGSCFGDSVGAFLASLSSDGDQGPSFPLRGSPWGLAPSPTRPPARPCGCWEWTGPQTLAMLQGRRRCPPQPGLSASRTCVWLLSLAQASGSELGGEEGRCGKERLLCSWPGGRASVCPTPPGASLCLSCNSIHPPPWAQALSSSCLFPTLGPWRGLLLLPRSCLPALEDPDVGEGFL